MERKRWYHSKTLWVNLIAAAATAVQAKYGFVVPPEYQGLALTAINMVLRAITTQPIE